MKALVLMLLLVPGICAAEVPVTLLGELTNIEETVNASASHARADLKGAGRKLRLTYSSQAPLNVFVVFLRDDGGFDPLRSLQATLPEGTNRSEEIDLTLSPSWTPFPATYRLYFFSENEAGAAFDDVTFVPSTAVSTLTAGLRHLLSAPPYSPLSYHRIAPHTVFTVSMTFAGGILLLVIAGTWFALRRTQAAIVFIVIVTLLCEARFSVDAVRYAAAHVREWYGNGTFSTAGSLPMVAADLLDRKAERAAICNDGTTYAKKLLQYHAFPTLLTEDDPQFVVVHRATDWSYANGTLRCGGRTYRAAFQTEYADGSLLYSVTP